MARRSWRANLISAKDGCYVKGQRVEPRLAFAWSAHTLAELPKITVGKRDRLAGQKRL
jgi:hypothetical protein